MVRCNSFNARFEIEEVVGGDDIDSMYVEVDYPEEEIESEKRQLVHVESEKEYFKDMMDPAAIADLRTLSRGKGMSTTQVEDMVNNHNAQIMFIQGENKYF